MLRSELEKLVRRVVGGNIEPELEVPARPEFGHYASSVALRLGKARGENPLELARELAKQIAAAAPPDFLEKAESAPPGFINFWLSPATFQAEVGEIMQADSDYGRSEVNRGKKVRIEYVSANPTGPLHVGNARGGPIGETLARVFEHLGAKVLREYVHNDVGTQVEKMGLTLWYWYEILRGGQADFPEGGYQGEYLKEIAEAALGDLGRDLTLADLSRLTQFGLELIFGENMKTIERMGIQFDLITKESELISSGKTAAAVKQIKTKGMTREKDGALWFAPQDEFLEDREAVIIRSSGQPTYFASDIAYHQEKFGSGYDLVIDVFGSNHHGHAPKLRALTKLFNFDPARLVILLYQFVRVKRGQEIIRMSKRAGTYVTAQEVLDEVGPDNFIFSLLLHTPETHLDFDLALAKARSMENPVYYAQYAYVRAGSILEKLGQETNLEADLTSLNTPADLALIRELTQFPVIVAEVSRDYQVQRLAQYGVELARAFHNFYEHERVIGEDPKIAAARAILVQASRIVLGNLFHLVGISAPERM